MTDRETQAMENDLLRRENQILRQRLEAEEHPGEHHGSRLIEDAEWRRLSKAEKDLKWLLTRLRRAPWGWVLRRFAGFRSLLARYLEP